MGTDGPDLIQGTDGADLCPVARPTSGRAGGADRIQAPAATGTG